MSLTIDGTRIFSNETPVYAEYRPEVAADGGGAWVVVGFRYGGRLFDRDQAITAMTIAEELERPNPDQALIKSLESELS